MAYADNPDPWMEDIVAKAVDAIFHVHRELGPGLLESVYEVCLAHELRKRGLRVDRLVTLPIVYDGVQIDDGLRLDLLVEGVLIIEVKAVEQLHPIHTAQLLTYLKLSHCQLGLLVNFNAKLIKDNIKRLAR